MRESAQASEKATALARLRYQYGVSDFLTVLDAERTLLQAQDQLAQSETNTATALVAVYKALGGGGRDKHGTDDPSRAQGAASMSCCEI